MLPHKAKNDFGPFRCCKQPEIHSQKDEVGQFYVRQVMEDKRGSLCLPF